MKDIHVLVGGPEKISNTFRLFQTTMTDAVFDADQGSDLHFEVRGRTPEHKRFFQIEVLIRRFYLFWALLIFFTFFLALEVVKYNSIRNNAI